MSDQTERPDWPFPSARTQILIAIIATCAWFGPRFIREAREAAIRSKVKNNLNQIHLAIQNYHATTQPAFAILDGAEEPEPIDTPEPIEPVTKEVPGGGNLIRGPAVMEKSLSSSSF